MFLILTDVNISPDQKRILYPGIVLLVGIIGAYLYFSFNPAQNALFPKCPFYLLTGWQCPGCGSQRAVHHLLHLDVPSAFRSNALLVFSIPYVVLGFVFDNHTSLRTTVLRKHIFGREAIMIVLLLITFFFIYRNIY